jgi:mannose-6-phosphate isomerase-like protein (cupin superfamily)
MEKQKIKCINWNDLPTKVLSKGVEVKIFSGEGITLQLARVKPEHVANLHSHPEYEQISYILKGSVDLFFGEDRYRFDTGSCFVIPPGVIHDGILPPGEEEALILGMWSPKRKEAFYAD